LIGSSARPVTVPHVPELELAGLAEVAKVCAVAKRTALSYTKRPDFPEPLDRLASGPVWRREDVEAWAKAHLPLPQGRPAAAKSPEGRQ
jgi:prophage regulatory protein